MSFSIAINIKIKNNTNLSSCENLIYDIANNLNNINIYYDYELEGINKFIKKSNKIMIIEFDNKNNLYNFIKIIKTIKEFMKEFTIDYIYNEDIILYASNKYLNNLQNNFVSKNELINRIKKK